MDRDRARLFDSEAERYDRSRPAYPAALVDDVLGPSPHGMSVLDLACGTGIASRAMTARGAQVLGVELTAGMAEIARRHGIATEVSSFETWDPAGRTFDLVTCAQAWHWLDPDSRVEKVVNVLRPSGRVCLFWSLGAYPDDLADAVRAVYRRVLPADGHPLMVGYAADRAGHDPVAFSDTVADELRSRAGLAVPQKRSFPWTRTYTRDLWLDELRTHSDHLALEPELRTELLDEIGATIDSSGGTFDMPYVTVLISATRR
jgi:SAM-dependent methyltransferase